jgi:hypothetical protein
VFKWFNSQVNGRDSSAALGLVVTQESGEGEKERRARPEELKGLIKKKRQSRSRPALGRIAVKREMEKKKK